METIKTAIQLLNAVCGDMETISVVGVENQSRFVDCAHAVQTVSRTLLKYVQDNAATEVPAQTEEASDG